MLGFHPGLAFPAPNKMTKHHAFPSHAIRIFPPSFAAIYCNKMSPQQNQRKARAGPGVDGVQDVIESAWHAPGEQPPSEMGSKHDHVSRTS